ncbi:hypothetical protein [Flagellimonas sp. GZD32]|uniref:hypothetical protein n=1 Tax=Flagellimonas cixiensis TaxID=3228750 RepID=UPI0035C91294
MGENKGVQYLFLQAVFPGFSYLIGKSLVFKKLENKDIVYLFIVIGIAYSLTSFMSVFKELIKNGFGSSDRAIPDFWTGQTQLATLMAASLHYNMLIPGILVANYKYMKKIIIVILIVIYIMSLLCMFRLGSRTGIVITALTFIFAILSLYLQQNIKQNLRLTFMLVLVTVVTINWFPLNLEAEYLSVLGQRLQDPNASSSSSAGGRTERWEEAIANIGKYPLGWNGRYAHNLWLDAAKVSGVIPVIFLIIFNVMNLFNLRKAFSLSGDNKGLNTVFVLFTAATFLFFFVEPVLEGAFFSFTTFCLFQGMIKKHLEINSTPNSLSGVQAI